MDVSEELNVLSSTINGVGAVRRHLNTFNSLSAYIACSSNSCCHNQSNTERCQSIYDNTDSNLSMSLLSDKYIIEHCWNTIWMQLHVATPANREIGIRLGNFRNVLKKLINLYLVNKSKLHHHHTKDEGDDVSPWLIRQNAMQLCRCLTRHSIGTYHSYISNVYFVISLYNQGKRRTDSITGVVVVDAPLDNDGNIQVDAYSMENFPCTCNPAISQFKQRMDTRCPEQWENNRE
ncbi:hypothetical protein RFI_39122 [Reticulomyxa filosa]|uniref:Uncharacterized protein n=1 Tax=Reticulomyxa filosa TaxID=46433 RepID=X6LA47_RETFI|nr:hypothetical protein RFI_39122 [Reticulomyxa filosa]|eukprot:ETN98388.1 hypothetical protein RFI_39122 [Reticulomyxa filosa]